MSTPDCRPAENVDFSRSSFCGTSSCVEVGAQHAAGTIAVRDSKDTRPDAPVLSFTADEWTAFVRGVAAGEFDVAKLTGHS